MLATLKVVSEVERIRHTVDVMLPAPDAKGLDWDDPFGRNCDPDDPYAEARDSIGNMYGREFKMLDERI